MPLYKAKPELLMPDVYSYPFPETRELLGGVALDQRFMINTIPTEDASHMLEGYNFKPSLELPQRADGTLDLDELHTPVIERIRSIVKRKLPGLEEFEHAYPTHGSSQSMFNLIAEWKANGSLKTLAVLEGEYEGYKANADTLHVPVTQYKQLGHEPPKEGEVWFISNPSALDGNWIDDGEWADFLEAGHQVIYDAAYVGLTPDSRTLDVSSPNILAVLTSPSKIFGVFRHRYTGVTYTRNEAKSMYGTKWFKDVPALLDTLALYENLGDGVLARKYRAVQEIITASLSEVLQLDARPSDVILLAHAKADMPEAWNRYDRRSNGLYRFGLTKLYEDHERTTQQ